MIKLDVFVFLTAPYPCCLLATLLLLLLSSTCVYFSLGIYPVFMDSGVWCMASGVWRFGVWRLGVWESGGLGVWESGIWSLASGVWHLEFGVWSQPTDGSSSSRGV
ncbi:hypothetical protein DFH27DRAFT_551099 [Peziza echinospora]|nr:hypothetical protein DFH27DRAFT_551099 [Peziza echinospora]